MRNLHQDQLTAQMQRLDTMGVVPDLVGSFDPEVELVVSARGLQHEAGGGHIPGDKIPPENARWRHFDDADVADAPAAANRCVRPASRHEAVHAGPRRPRSVHPVRAAAHRADYPDEARDAFQQYCHWLVTDLPLSPTSMSVEAATVLAQVAIPYQPPHPQRGTKPHRLVIALLRQSGRLSAAAPTQRTRFDVRSLIRAHSLDPVGLHFFRSEWSPAVSGIYAELGQAEPHYRHPQDVAIDPYRVHGGQMRSPFFQT